MTGRMLRLSFYLFHQIGLRQERMRQSYLKLRMELEDVQSKLADAVLDKVFPKESHPLMDCPDCGKHWGYHHEEHCKAKK